MNETLRPDAPAGPDPLIGQVIGGAYEVVRLLGAGGMGNVYEARHTRLPKRFAIKVVKGDLAKDEAAFERFKREAEIASSLGNKHIVEVLDFNILPDGSPYMVMEFLTGEDLAGRLGRQKRLRPEEANLILGQVVSALDAAHARGIVHRDIKPENIFLAQLDDDSEFVKLLDFGLSKIRGSQKRLTANLSVLGTPWYMSPEQARGDADLDHRTDIYALAVVLYQVLCGRVPFEGENVYGVLTQIATQPPPPITRFAPEVPRELESVLARALAKDSAARYGSVREFWEAAQGGMGVTVVRKSLPSARVSGPSGEAFRVPTPSQLQVGHAPTLASSKDDLAAPPIPLTRISERSRNSADRPPPPVASAELRNSDSMMAVQRAAFPERGRSSRVLLIAAVTAVLLTGIGLAVYRLSRPGAPPMAVEPIAKAAPKPSLAVVTPPKPAAAPAVAPTPSKDASPPDKPVEQTKLQPAEPVQAVKRSAPEPRHKVRAKPHARKHATEDDDLIQDL